MNDKNQIESIEIQRTSVTDENLVYYYCSVQTFMSIVSNQTLMLSDPTKMNDADELHQAVKLLREEAISKYFNDLISGLKKKPPLGWSEEEVSRINKDHLIKYTEVIDEAIDSYPNLNVFMICFSKERDLLSQWFKYADNGHGLAIGFDPSKLFKGQRNVSQSKVSYYSGSGVKRKSGFLKNKNTFISILNAMLASTNISSAKNGNDYYSHYTYYRDEESDDETEASINLGNPKTVTKIESVIKKYLMNLEEISVDDFGLTKSFGYCVLTPFLLSKLLKIKNPGFKEEKEFRMIFCGGVTTMSKHRRNIRIVKCEDRDTITPYITLPFHIEDIREIVCGPKCQVGSRELEQVLMTAIIKRLVDKGCIGITRNSNSGERRISLEITGYVPKDEGKVDVRECDDAVRKCDVRVYKSKTKYR